MVAFQILEFVLFVWDFQEPCHAFQTVTFIFLLEISQKVNSYANKNAATKTLLVKLNY